MPRKKPITKEDVLFSAQGVNGESVFKTFSNEINPDISISNLRRMLSNDGQIRMIYNVIVNTILSSGWRIDDDKDAPKNQTSEEKVFVEDMLKTPYYAGGLKSSVGLTNRRMLRAILEGYRVFEVIYKIVGNKIVLSDLAPRSTINNAGLKLLDDDSGYFIGFEQKVFHKSKYTEVKVVNEEGKPTKVLKSTMGEEFGSLYGQSMFESAYYHYDKAHKGMYLNHVGHELGAVKYRVLESKGTAEQTRALVNILERTGMESVVSYDPNIFKLDFPSVSDSQVMAVGKDMINLHYSMIAKSLLAQFLDLGSNIGETGSRATSDSHVEVFRNALDWIGAVLVEDQWNKVIYDLININFASNIFPKFRLNPISDRSVELMLTVFSELAKKNFIPKALRNSILARGAEELEIDISKEELEQSEESSDTNNQNQPFSQSTNTQVKNAEQVKLQEEFKSELIQNPYSHYLDSDIEPIRDLYPDEKKVKLAEIKNKLTQKETEAKNVLYNKLQKQKDGAVNLYIAAMRQGIGAIKKAKIELADEFKENTYSEEIEQIALDIFNFGKVQAINELGKDLFSTPKKTLQNIRIKIGFLVDEQEQRLNLRLSTVVADLASRNVAENEAKILIENEYDDFFNKVLNPTINSVLPKYMNEGRQVVFDKYQSGIWAYRYTAVLDNKTTDYCRTLDGSVVQINDPQFAVRTPPQHFGCRSIWTPISYEERDQFNLEVTGIPANLPAFSSVSSFKDI